VRRRVLLRNDAQQVEPAVPATVDLVMLATPLLRVAARPLARQHLVLAQFLLLV